MGSGLKEAAVRDIEFYAQVLGLTDPWFVEDVDLSVENKRVDITVSHHEGRLWACPACEAELPVFDHSEKRAWRHLDTVEFPTWLHARPPRVEVPDRRGPPGPLAVGRAPEPLHHGLRALRHRR